VLTESFKKHFRCKSSSGCAAIWFALEYISHLVLPGWGEELTYCSRYGWLNGEEIACESKADTYHHPFFFFHPVSLLSVSLSSPLKLHFPFSPCRLLSSPIFYRPLFNLQILSSHKCKAVYHQLLKHLNTLVIKELCIKFCNSLFCSQSVLTVFARFSEQTAMIRLSSSEGCSFIADINAFFSVGHEQNFYKFKIVHIVYVCFHTYYQTNSYIIQIAMHQTSQNSGCVSVWIHIIFRGTNRTLKTLETTLAWLSKSSLKIC
jgi:hypothetical protein